MNKRLEVHNIHVDTNMDADDFGNRLITCIENCSNSANVVNLIKVKVGESIRAYELEKLLTPIKDAFKEQELTNCVFVPIINGIIEDVTVDYIKRLSKMKLTDKQRKKLIKVYPFLKPRNLWTGKEIEDADWIVGEVIPDGWIRLFLMYCKDLKPYLVNSNYLDKFMFTDVKEKYGTLRLNNHGEPRSSRWLTLQYEQFSEYVCCLCGELATKQTEGYIMSLCDSCAEKDCFLCWKTVELPKKLQAGVTMYENGTAQKLFFSLKHLKKQYEYILNMSDEAFIEYMLTE